MEYVSPFDERRRAPSRSPRAATRSKERASRCSTSPSAAATSSSTASRRVCASTAPRRSASSKEIFSKPAEPELIRRIADRGDLAVEGLAD